MPARRSAGLLLIRPSVEGPEFLLGHMGGPFWSRKDERAWSIPKGEYGEDEDAFAAARREFAEELGSPAPDVDYLPLRPRRASGKQISIWVGRADFDADAIVSNTVELEWPPRSGHLQQFPEIDRAAWFGLVVAREKIVAGQLPFLEEAAALG